MNTMMSAANNTEVIHLKMLWMIRIIQKVKNSRSPVSFFNYVSSQILSVLKWFFLSLLSIGVYALNSVFSWLTLSLFEGALLAVRPVFLLSCYFCVLGHCSVLLVCTSGYILFKSSSLTGYSLNHLTAQK